MEDGNQLSPLVQQVYEAHKKLRQDPKSFIPVLEDIIQHFAEDGKLLRYPDATPVMHHEGLPAYEEAIKFLKKQKPVDVELYFSDLLQKSAQDHASDIGSNGKTGHTGTDNSTYGQRIERYCKWGGAIFESIDYSRPEVTGDRIVAKLLADDGIKSKNHRKAIFQEAYKHIGIAEAEHTELGRVVVIDYGAQIISHKDYEQMQVTPVVEEVKKSSVDVSKINWAELSRKVGEEINKVRKNPRHLIKQMERSLSLFKKYKVLTVPGRETREFKEGAPAYIEAIEF